MFRETFESEFTWLEGFMRNVRRYSKKTAAIDAANDIKWTYEELNRASNLLANALRDGGVKKGDLISSSSSSTIRRNFCSDILLHTRSALCSTP